MNQSTQSIKFATYNCHLFRNMLAGAKYAEDERLQRIPEHVAACDREVVGLCEVWSDETKELVARACAPAFPYAFFVTGPKLDVGNGLVIVSRYPLLDRTCTFFQAKAGVDEAVARKGILQAVVAAPGGMVRVFMLHTQADGAKLASPAQCLAARRAQLEQLRERIAAYHPELPAVVMGDFNVIGDSAEYSLLRELLAGFTDAHVAAHPGEPGFTFEETNRLTRLLDPEAPSEPSARLDYIWVSGPGAGVQACHVPTHLTLANGVECSDHNPVFADLVVAAGGAARDSLVFDTAEEARLGVLALASGFDGTGHRTYVMIHNNTAADLAVVDAITIDGGFYGNGHSSSYSYPSLIPRGKYGALFYVHPTNDPARGPEGGLVYRSQALARDILLAWEAPWLITSKNKSLARVAALEAWRGKPAEIKRIINDEGYYDTQSRDAVIAATGHIETGDAPPTLFQVTQA